MLGRIISDEENKHSDGTGSIEKNCTVIITFDVLVTGDGVDTGDMIRNQALVSYNDRDFEEYNKNELTGQIEDDVNVSEIVSFRLLEHGTIQIEKQLDQEADEPQQFVFQIAYQQNSWSPVSRIFYATADIVSGDDHRIVQLGNMCPGIYQVTEVQGNWNYTLDSGSALLQTGVIDGLNAPHLLFSYQNNESVSALVNGKAHVIFQER